MGYAAAEVAPVVARLREMMLALTRIFADETVVPVLDPGRGRTKQGYFWAMARDDRPWGGSQPPAVVYSYAPGRGHTHANRCSVATVASCSATATQPTRNSNARIPGDDAELQPGDYQTRRSDAGWQAAPRRQPRAHVVIGNVVGKADKRGNLYPTKGRPDQKIDAAVALMMAVAVARWWKTSSPKDWVDCSKSDLDKDNACNIDLCPNAEQVWCHPFQISTSLDQTFKAGATRRDVDNLRQLRSSPDDHGTIREPDGCVSRSGQQVIGIARNGPYSSR